MHPRGPMGPGGMGPGNGASYDGVMPPGDPRHQRLGNGRSQPGRSRTYGGYSDMEYDPMMPGAGPGGGPGPGPGGGGAGDYGPGAIAPGPLPPRAPRGGPMGGGPGGVGPPPPMRGATARRDPHLEFGDSDIESVVSATSAFSSQSAPHARARRLG